MLDFALELVRVEDLMMDSWNVRTITWNVRTIMFVLSHRVIFKINKIVYLECSVSPYTL